MFQSLLQDDNLDEDEAENEIITIGDETAGDDDALEDVEDATKEIDDKKQKGPKGSKNSIV